MKKIVVSFCFVVFLASMAWTQCEGVQLKPGAESFKKFTNGCQVQFEFCGVDETLVKHQDLLVQNKLNAQLTFDKIDNGKFACTLTIQDSFDPDYAVKIMGATGFTVVHKGDRKLTINDYNLWFK